MGRPGVSVSIEPMHPGDLEAVAAVEAEAFAEPWSQELFTSEIAQQSPFGEMLPETNHHHRWWGQHLTGQDKGDRLPQSEKTQQG